jgi:hypothetical protein
MHISLNLGFVSGLVFLLIELAWIASLVHFLKRTDLDSTTKICWVIVLCTLNLLGMILLAIWGPKQQQDTTPVRRLFEPAKKDETGEDISSA